MTDATCSEADCDKKPVARGLCEKHYRRAAKAGLPPLPKPTRNADLQCSVKKCTNPAAYKDLCRGHYDRQRRSGDAQADVPFRKKRPKGTAKCSRDDCDEPYLAKDMCKKHYMEDRGRRLSEVQCVVKGCDRPRGTSSGYCVRCYQRWLKHGDPLAGGPMRRLRGTGNRWEHDENRRAARAKMSQVTGETLDYVKILRRDPCAYCGAPSEHIDHIVPFSKDGPTHWENLAPACSVCNHQKSATDLLPFLLGRLAAAA